VSEGTPDGRRELPEAPAFAALRARLHGVDLTRAVYLDRGIHVTAYRAGPWVLRVPRTTAARKRILDQAHVYQVMAARGLPVPRDAGLAHDAEGEVAAGFYRYVPGEPAIASRRTPGLARDLGRFLSALHAVPVELVRGSSEEVSDLWAERFRPCWDRCRPHLPAGARAWLEGVIARFLASRETTGGRLVPTHGDLTEEHVLVGPDGRLGGIIDPSGPRITDPALDFGSLTENFGWAFADAVLAAYTGPLDPGFARRVSFCASVRPLVTIDAGLRHRSEERFRRGLTRLTERMADAREPR
jgi:aminoglycoside phosphotransferase (APT) family kinase protein